MEKIPPASQDGDGELRDWALLGNSSGFRGRGCVKMSDQMASVGLGQERAGSAGAAASDLGRRWSDRLINLVLFPSTCSVHPSPIDVKMFEEPLPTLARAIHCSQKRLPLYPIHY